MKSINIMKVLGIITSLFLLPSISNAQIQRVWNIAEYTSTMLPPPATGTKVAYRTLNNSLYYWDGTQWKRLAGPGIVDTSYSLSFSSPTLSLLGSGSSVSLTNLYTAGYGLIKTAEAWRVDTTSPDGVATRKYAKTLPTSIAATRVAVSNGTNLVGYPGFTYNGSTTFTMGATGGSAVLTFPNSISGFSNYISTTYGSNQGDIVFGNAGMRLGNSGILINTSGSATSISLVPGSHYLDVTTSNRFFSGSHATLPGYVGLGTGSPAYFVDINSTNALRLPRGTDAQRPTNAFGLLRGNTTGNGLEFGNGTNWSYLLRTSLVGGVGSVNHVPYFGSDGYITSSARLTYASDYLFTVKAASYPTIQIQSDAGNIFGKMESAGPYGLFSLLSVGNVVNLYLSGQGNSSGNFINGNLQLGATTGKTSFLDITPNQSGGDISGAGYFLRVRSANTQNNVSPASTTIASGSFASFEGGSTTAVNTGITYTDFSTVRIAAAPTNSTNTSIQYPWALQVVTGNTNLGTGHLYLPGQEIRFGPISAKGNLNVRAYWGGGVNSSIQMGAVNTVNTSYINGGIFIGSQNTHFDGIAAVVGNQNTITTPSGATILGSNNIHNTMSGSHITVGNNNTNSAYTNGQVASIIVGDFNNTNGFYGGGLFGTNLKYYANKQLGFGGNSNSVNFAISDVYFGHGVRNENNGVNSNNGHGPNISINPSQAYAGTDQNGGNLNLNGGIGTSAGIPGDVNIATSTALATGSVYQTLTNRVIVKGTSGFVGIGTSSPARTLHVTGEVRITDLVTDPATQVIGADADGDISVLTLVGDLGVSAGVLRGADSLKHWSNVLFVSPNGNDGAAVKNKLTRPWLTLQAARDAAVSGDLVVVLTGTYARPTNIWKDGVDWHFEDVLISGSITTEYSASNCPWKATSSGTVNVTGNLKTDQLIRIDTAGVNFTATGFRLGQIFIGGGAIGAKVNVRTVETPGALYVSANNADPITDNVINFYADEWVDTGFGHYPIMFINNTSSNPKKNNYTIEIGSVVATSWPDYPLRGILQGRTVNHRFDSCTTVIKIGKGIFNISTEWGMLGYYPYQAGTGNSTLIECDDCEFKGSARLGARLVVQGQDLLRIKGKYTTYSKTFPMLDFEVGHASAGQRLVFDGEFIGIDTTLFQFDVNGNYELTGRFRNYEADDKIVDQTVANSSFKSILRNAYIQSAATTPIQSSIATTWYAADAYDYATITKDADITFQRENEYATATDGNGLYTGSGTIANHTTRALIPSTGNLLFSQTYNSTDSAYIQVINNLDGNREVRIGLTDTITTGYTNFRVYQDEADEEMGWEALTNDGSGTTTVRGQGGNLSMYADGTYEMRGAEIRLNNGEVLMNQYGQDNMKPSDLGQTSSNFVAGYSTTGKVVDFQIRKDTFTEDASVTITNTSLGDCSELFITTSMTNLAAAHLVVSLPIPSASNHNKRVSVWNRRKDAGLFVPVIDVTGGGSTLYYTANTATTAPSDQTTLTLDGTTWHHFGKTYVFNCVKINSTDYRWVLDQR